jgi:hypothetical protein
MVKAIITGDVIHSTRMTVEERTWLFRSIADALKIWNEEFGMKSETFRGDSFQCLLHKPSEALKMALILKTYIRSLNPSDVFEVRKKMQPQIMRNRILPRWIFDARIAVGIGEVDLQSRRLAASGGMAYQLSGHLLDEMKTKKQSIGIATNDNYNDEFETESILLDAIISKTSALQCEVITLKLLGHTELAIAKKLGIMQSAVNQRSNSGNWNAIETMVKRFEKIYSA